MMMAPATLSSEVHANTLSIDMGLLHLLSSSLSSVAKTSTLPLTSYPPSAAYHSVLLLPVPSFLTYWFLLSVLLSFARH